MHCFCEEFFGFHLIVQGFEIFTVILKKYEIYYHFLFKFIFLNKSPRIDMIARPFVFRFVARRNYLDIFFD